MNQLMKCSAELEHTLEFLLELEPYDDSIRVSSSIIMCNVAMEHARSIKILIGSSNFTSATALTRLQYESLVRAMWLLYAASDIEVSKLMTELTEENEKKANRLPMLSQMLKQLEGKAPQEAVNMVNEFKNYSWKSLCSYVHGGIHVVNRQSNGYPLPLITQVIKTSNGISTMTGMLLAILSGNTEIVGIIKKIQLEFIDCLPSLKN